MLEILSYQIFWMLIFKLQILLINLATWCVLNIDSYNVKCIAVVLYYFVSK